MSLVRYEGGMDPIETPFDFPRQALYLHHLRVLKIRSKAARAAGIRLHQVNALRNRDRDFAEREAASLEEAAEAMIESTEALAAQGDIKAFQALTPYYMPDTYAKTPGSVHNTQINVLDAGAQGVREALEQIRQAAMDRAAELEPSARRESE